jgi:hypothetical protein
VFEKSDELYEESRTHRRRWCALNEFTLALSCVGMAVDADPKIRMKALNDPDLERVWLGLQED